MKELFEKEAMSLATEVTDNSNVNKEDNVMGNEIINAKSPEEVREVLIGELESLHEDISHCSDELDGVIQKILDEPDIDLEEKVNVVRISEKLSSIYLWFDIRIRLVEQSLSFRDNHGEQSYHSVINDMTELYELDINYLQGKVSCAVGYKDDRVISVMNKIALLLDRIIHMLDIWDSCVGAIIINDKELFFEVYQSLVAEW